MKNFLTICVFTSIFLVACTNGDTASTRPPRGNPNAVVLVEEYADLQCPACRAAHGMISIPIVQKYSSQIRFEYKHFPLRSIHRFALDAAEMSECAADQGKFWEFVDFNYEHQEDLNLDALVEWAEALGMDADLAERCWKSHSKRGTVLADYKEGREREVSGTPTFFVNGVRVEAGMDTLSEAIDKALEGAVMKL